MAAIRLVVGLGNPGREHDATRHNAGFWFADALAARLALSFASEGRFHGMVARGAGDLRILKPGTYMNLSGRAVAALARFFGIGGDEILVVHDELDLKPGEAKMKFGGGHAGHNGLRDISAALGTRRFLAIAPRHRPSARFGDPAAGGRRLRAAAAAARKSARRCGTRSIAASTHGRRSPPAISSGR